ncbi:hypothetical protein OH77DRAFT_1419826 [Trametes cingulata]|nr:hypothetical protein OH77DRAFT_1419826 [Trametes cingulata]
MVPKAPFVVSGAGRVSDDLELDVVPVFPQTISFKCTMTIGTKKVVKSIARTQLPLVPAYAYTELFARCIRYAVEGSLFGRFADFAAVLGVEDMQPIIAGVEERVAAYRSVDRADTASV